MKTVFLLLAITIATAANAQVVKVSLQASGLTCSMCSNAITKALRTLDFVDKIEEDLKSYTYEITFRQNTNVDFDRMRQKVEGAGFSISEFVATINFDKVQLANDQSITVGSQTLIFLNASSQLLDGARRVTILKKGFVSSKQAKRNPVPIASPGTYYVAI